MCVILYVDNKNCMKGKIYEDGEFELSISTQNFSGSYRFCVEILNLENDIYNLERLYEKLLGEYSFADMDSQSNIKFIFEKHGKLNVSGQLGNTINNNYIVFEFIADQTLLSGFISFLKKAVKHRRRYYTH